MNIYVANLAYEVADQDLRNLFAQYGEVSSSKVITDSYSGQSRGFGFVEMDDAAAAQKAIAELNGSDLKGRSIVVNEAKPKKDNGGRPASRGSSSRSGGDYGRRY